jgi:hypothetical protein
MNINLSPRLQKFVLNGLLILIITFIELGILFLNYHVFYGSDLGSIYVKIAAIILLAWLGMMLGFYAWAIYFYNVNFGMTNEDWSKIKQQQEEAEKLRSLDIEPPPLTIHHPVENPYKDETFGLPPGTVRATIAITVLIAGVSMLFVSFDPKAIAVVSVHEKYLEYFKTAFLMMIAFYFGSQSLRYLKSDSKNVLAPEGDTNSGASGSTSNASKEVVTETSNATIHPSSNKNIALKHDEASELLVETKHMENAVQLQSANKKLNSEDVLACAKDTGLEPALIYTVLSVESSGKGFGPEFKPIILFEGHVFWKNLKTKGIDPAQFATQHPDIVYPKWTRKYYSSTQQGEHARLDKAMLIDREAALMSASWGLFQILGENFSAAGFSSVEEFVSAQEKSELEQLKSFIQFIKSQKLISYLEKHNWREFAKRYNGPGYEANHYHLRLEEAYAKQLKRLEPGVKVKIVRTSASEVETLGNLEVYNAERLVFSCKTLELPWKNNERNVSCIPLGTYEVAKRFNETHKQHFHIQDVPNRNWILIHSGNYYSDIRGCVLVGLKHIDINNDGVLDISNSRETLAKLYQILPDSFSLQIV